MVRTKYFEMCDSRIAGVKATIAKLSTEFRDTTNWRIELQRLEDARQVMEDCLIAARVAYRLSLEASYGEAWR